MLSEVLAAGGFEGKPGQRTRAVRVLGAKAAHVALAGLGKREKAAVVSDWGQSVYQVSGAAGSASHQGAGAEQRACGSGTHSRRRRSRPARRQVAAAFVTPCWDGSGGG